MARKGIGVDDIHTCHNECQRPICVAVREAVAAEREACAVLCEEQAKSPALGIIEKYRAEFIAAAIRARGQNGL